MARARSDPRSGLAARVTAGLWDSGAFGAPLPSLALGEPCPRSFNAILKPHAGAFHRLLLSRNLKWIRLWSGQESEVTVFFHQRLF